MKKLIIIITFGLIVGALPAYAQSSTSSTTTSSYTSSQSTPEDKAPVNITGITIGAIAVIVLGGIVLLMVRNRKRTIGGMQRQDKSDPRPATTESINNPGSGV